MAGTPDPQYIHCHYIIPKDQAKAPNDRLLVDIVALYIRGTDGVADKLPDFVFQDQNQPPEKNGEDESARIAPAPPPNSPDLLERGQLPPGSDARAQPGTDKDGALRNRSYLRSHRAHYRKQSTTDKRVNWLADGGGELFRKAIQPLTIPRIIGVSIDLKRMSNLSFAEASKEVSNKLNELWRKYIGCPIVFLCHGYATFLLQDVLEANENKDLRLAIAAIGMFGVDPKDRDIVELRKWTAEKRCGMSPQSPLLNNNCQDDFGTALDNLRKDHFISVFAFCTDPTEVEKSEKTEPMFSVSDRDPIWSGGGLEQIAMFSGLEDAGFRGMCKYIVESVEGHQLLTAARENNRDMIMSLINRGANIDSINYTSRNYKTALSIAAEAGHVETVEFLSIKDYVSLDHGVDHGKSALQCAVQAIKDLIGKINSDDMDRAHESRPNATERILYQLKEERGRPPHLIESSEDTGHLSDTVKQFGRAMKVVEILLGAGALPSSGLLNTLNVQNQLEKKVRQLLCNPPAVQGPSPRRLTLSTPSEQALEVCRNTPLVIREVFSAGEDEKDQYIPVYTDINEVIYQKKSSPQVLQTGSNARSPSNGPSAAVSISEPPITLQSEDSPVSTDRSKATVLGTSEKVPNDTDQEFNIDDEFKKRKKNFRNAGSRLICRWYHIPMNNPWPQGYRDYKPRSRAVYPQFVKPKPLFASTTEPSPIVHAIMIPYLSYEKSYRTLIEGMLESGFSGQLDEDEDAGELEEIYRETLGESREDRWMKRLMGFSSSARPRDDSRSEPRSFQRRSHFDFSDTYKRNQNDTSGVLANASKHAAFAPSSEALANAYLNYKHDSGYRLPLHPRVYSHYYMLRDTTCRDRTQVVSRWFRRNRRMEAPERYYNQKDQALFEEEDHNILMVDQLWIWLIKDDKSDQEADVNREKVTLVTSFPDRFGTKSAARNNIAQQVFRDSTRDSFQNVSDLVRQIISVCLRTLNEAHVDGSVSFLQCFEISIGNLEERSAQSFLEFRRLSEFLEHLDEQHPDYLSRRGLLLKMLLRISKDSRILSEVKDVLDEIGMIQSVLHAQRSVLSDDDGGELDLLLGVQRERAPLYNELRRIIGNFEQMKLRAQSIVDSIEKLLDMKQKHANLWEARTSREGSELAAKAGNFPKNDGGDTNWPLNSVLGLLYRLPFLHIHYWARSVRIEQAVRKYDPKYERIVEHLMGENGTEVIKDDDLDEEDDLIREWRRYYNKPRGIF
ncbi:hypothetical protein G7054_g10313 [Neopestalotiopsis clavispora]|nr:hypothetical protein G7054_g10313 [Neopestalotiopsis clavispora]